ncbi:MAG TPA: S8 family serine peptidase, partial [Candidatus Angelobacter sp.]|nr:S8 family serine peptidase [Candidatus Angelobacter sp.]
QLRAKGDPGSYVVQSRGPLDGAFYTSLRNAGAEFVSYIPNNAGLVRVSADGARQLAALPGIRAVMSYEPYYKLAQPLLALAMQNQSLPLDRSLNVTFFPGAKDAALPALRDLGAEVIAEERTPFGQMVTINPHPDSLVTLAQLQGVERIEPANRRTLLNDLSRVRTGVSEDAVTPLNYLGLTGTNVTVNINDTGVDQSHPDLAGRVFFSSTDTNLSVTQLDTDGHGTHVAGTIISSGGLSATVFDTLGNPPSGSVTNANFRGKAPAANLFVLPIDLQVGPIISDSYLQETAASNNFVGLGHTNAFVSNNSWSYNGAFEYNSASASFDAAVRDAMPEITGSQPIVYVFAAGNSGFGSTNGTVGEPDSISAPATAKNVITVGAIESFRNITNETVINGETNAPFLGYTDSDNQVAAFSSRGNVGIGTEGDFGRFKPDVVAPGTFVVSTLSLNMDASTIDPLIPSLGPYYRYETGTSMAAPSVSGILALMQEFFEQKLKRSFSPALMKALLINGARSVNPDYDLSPSSVINLQGWGLVNITNSLPTALTNTTDETSWPVRFFDQSPTNVVATGQRRTWNLGVSADGQVDPLRVTLVWTDPPGNPGAGVKLVNDLDLIVTNLDTGEVFLGNNMPVGFDFTQPSDLGGTNAAPFDFVNNVENVFLQPPLGTNYSITVVGRRVSVNAVTANTNGIVQDFALVMSSGNGELSDAFMSLTSAAANPVERTEVIGLTNGMPLLKQRVGANFQLSPSVNGDTNQWRFYVFTNAFFTNNTTGLTNGSNVAFITFLPPDLSRPRNLDADIDLYVSMDPALTNLDGAAITNSFKSLNRGGTEVVVFTNAVVGLDQIYYIGVKSEDQQGAEFGIVSLSTDTPFDAAGDNGSRILRGMPPTVEIPDGAPDQPGAALMFAIGIRPETIARVIVTNDITHQSVGDLLGNLSHEDQFAVLNNHNRYDGTTNTFFHLVYDDSGSGQFLLSRRTEGPGSLNSFVGERSTGVWLLTMTDDARGRTGRVDGLTLRVEPNQDLFGTNGVAGSVLGNQWVYYFVDVPVDGSKLTITLSQVTGPLNLYLKRGGPPSTTDFDKSALIDPPGGSLSIGLGDVPPLNAGRYFIGVFNPGAATVTFRIRADLDFALAPQAIGDFLSTDTPSLMLDDAVTRSSIFVPIAREVADVRVGVRIDDPRASDLVLHLVSPQGTRVLLTENRGRTNTLGYGISEGLATNQVTLFTNTFEGAAATNYFVGDVVDGWKVTDNLVGIRNDGSIAFSGTNSLALRSGRISRTLPTTAGRSYQLNFAYRLNPGPFPANIVGWWPALAETATARVGNSGQTSGITYVPGEVDEAFSFDGVTSLITVPDWPRAHLTGDFTIEFWVNPDAAQNPYANILHKEDSLGTDGFGIEMDAATNSNLYFAGWKNAGSTPGNECWTTAPFQLTPGVWQHVAVVKSGTTRSVYINGVLVGSATCTANSAVGVNTAPLQIGAWSGRANSAWKGILDEISIYDRALTVNDIQDILLSGNAGKCADLVPPVYCSSQADVLLDGSAVDRVAGETSWRTRSIRFTAVRNGTPLELAPVGYGMLFDQFSLVETRVSTVPFYAVFTENTNLTDVPIKFALAPFTNSTVVTSLTNSLVVDDGFENATNGTYLAGDFVSGWQVSTGQVTVFGIPNPLGLTNYPNGFPPHVPGKKFLVLNGGWSSTDTNGIITNWIPGGVITNFSTTANGQYLLSFMVSRDPGRDNILDPPTPPVVSVLTNGVVATNIIIAGGAGWITNTMTLQADTPATSLEFRSF